MRSGLNRPGFDWDAVAQLHGPCPLARLKFRSSAMKVPTVSCGCRIFARGINLSYCRRRFYGWKFYLCLMVLGAFGCRAVPNPNECFSEAGIQRRIHSLAEALGRMDASVKPNEAHRVAESSLQASARLASEYAAIRPAWLHNIFVNCGLRERGLCWQWAEDLMPVLRDLGVESLEFRPVVAHPGNILLEHNAIAAGNERVAPSRWIILDAWRYSGCLYWVPLAEDSFPWRYVYPDGSLSLRYK